MTGLADMHVHLEYFEDPHLLKLFLANGVTTVRIPAEGRAQWEGRIRRATERMDAADWTLVAQGKTNRTHLVRGRWLLEA